MHYKDYTVFYWEFLLRLLCAIIISRVCWRCIFLFFSYFILLPEFDDNTYLVAQGKTEVATNKTGIPAF